MISAEVIKGVQELLEGHGVQQRPGEKFSDFVARGLSLSARQTEVLLDTLHDGHDVQEAIRAAEIGPNPIDGDLLVQLARVIGAALGRVVPKK